ncbi:MAG: fibrillarin-like rRNA/tRNA 2'-O-methyltransferase [Candidatus Diapherotrites archaeon]
MKELFFGIFSEKGRIFTKNLSIGKKVYGEKLVEVKGIEYREWIPYRSKLCAAIKNGLSIMPLKEGSNILYLGIAEGTTASHISDIIGLKGAIFGVDISEKTMTRLLRVCEDRQNILPILADAARPEEYAEHLKGCKIDLLYQDVAQKNQAEIFNRNAELFLSKGDFGMIAIKSQSISSTQPCTKVFSEQKEVLEEKFKVLQEINLKPFEKDHMFYLLQKK